MVVVGGGVVGVGVVVVFKDVGFENYVVIECEMVGVFFVVWLVEMCFIMLFFVMNVIGMLDLNFVVIGILLVYIF